MLGTADEVLLPPEKAPPCVASNIIRPWHLRIENKLTPAS